MDYVDLMKIKCSIEMKQYIQAMKVFIQKVETNSVSDEDKSNVWYSSYIDCTKLMLRGRRQSALNRLVSNMKFDVKSYEIRLNNYHKNGNFAVHPNEVGFIEVQRDIKKAYDELFGFKE